MPTILNVAKADFSVESAFVRPEFEMFQDTPALIRHVFAYLQPHMPQLRDTKLERGNDNVGDLHLVSNLYESRVGVRIYMEKVTLACLNVLDVEIEKFSNLIIEAVSAVKQHRPSVAFRTHTLTVVLHGTLEGKSSVSDYLGSVFVTKASAGLGPLNGIGGVMYFGPDEDRILSTMTLDHSLLVANGLFVRPYVVWDASKIDVPALPLKARAFIRHALNVFGLDVPSLARSS